MAGKSPVTTSDEQRGGLLALAGSRDRSEADRARAVLLTLAGWTSSKIAEAFGVREDTVRLWRSDFMRGGVAALEAHAAPGPAPNHTMRWTISMRISTACSRTAWRTGQIKHCEPGTGGTRFRSDRS
jgi:transposase